MPSDETFAMAADGLRLKKAVFYLRISIECAKISATVKTR
jgi:hypothetical protein